jgi:hypothetical protein
MPLFPLHQELHRLLVGLFIVLPALALSALAYVPKHRRESQGRLKV